MFRPMTKSSTLGTHQLQPWNVPHWLREQLNRLHSSLFGSESLDREERQLRIAEDTYRRTLTDRERERMRHEMVMRLWLDSASGLR